MIFSPKEEDHVLLNRFYAELSVRHGEGLQTEIRGMICQVEERFSATRIRNYTTADISWLTMLFLWAQSIYLRL